METSGSAPPDVPRAIAAARLLCWAPMGLQDQLDEITANTRRLVQPERLAPVERAIDELLASGATKGVVSPGSPAPPFALEDARSSRVRSDDLLALGPLVVSFFRGRWCPYCITELLAWKDAWPHLRARGALLVAISPQTVRHNEFTVLQHGLPFPVLSDPGNGVARRFGLVSRVPDYLQRHYRGVLVNIPFMNGDATWELPLPATFAIGPDGLVRSAEVYADFRRRPEPDSILSRL